MAARQWTYAALAVAALALATLVSVALLATAQEPTRSERGSRVPMVRVEPVAHSREALRVAGDGTLVAAERLELSSEVPGRLVHVSDELKQGNVVRKGELLAEIRRDDYRLALEEALAAVKQVEAQIELEQGLQAAARHEWHYLREVATRVPGPIDDSLVLREPQMHRLDAQLRGARAQVARARLNLHRTRIEAPFDALVEDESVATGDEVARGAPLAELVAVDEFWIEVSVPVDRMPFVPVPSRSLGETSREGEASAPQGGSVTVFQDLGRDRRAYEGRTLRWLGSLDPAGRMARLLVAVRDPLGLESHNDTPLLLGTYVTVRIETKDIGDLVAVPSAALHDEGDVYVFEPDASDASRGRLAIRRPDIAWRENDTVFVSDGIDADALVITTRVGAAVDGMRLQRPSANAPTRDDRPQSTDSADG